ncbi:MAG TPA: phosphatase PAP2 family protein [Nocardioidaceae bacterium]|nr:phosphatase PAP2 family protein [Nocardioidaceae bacterium]
MTSPPRTARLSGGREVVRGWLADAVALDAAVYAAVARTPTPTLDRALSRVSTAANHSKLWVGCALALAVAGGRPGRAAAADGLASVAVTSAVVNLALKRAGGRGRPDRAGVPGVRHVEMPGSLSFPSGHAASASAFATGVGGRLPVVAAPLHGAAGVVAYSRVHTGVHHPLDVLVGWIVGTLLAQLTTRFAGGLAARAVGRVSGRAGRARGGSWPARGTARGRAAA